MSVRPVIVAIGHVFPAPVASRMYFSARTEGRIYRTAISAAQILVDNSVSKADFSSVSTALELCDATFYPHVHKLQTILITLPVIVSKMAYTVLAGTLNPTMP